MSVSVKYKGTEIAAMSETGTKTLLTYGTYCDADIVVENTKDSGGEPSAPTEPSDITFIDYDGTVVAAWTLAELASKTALPDAPTHDGLIFQEWNYTLAELKEKNAQIVVGALYDTDDSSTRIYIHLEEGRTSPMLGCCPRGTATIDWGDGSATNTLTGSNTKATVKWTSTHEYAAPGDYVIKITMNDGGTLGFYGSVTTNQYSCILRQQKGTDVRNLSYLGAVKKIELGKQVTDLDANAFNQCYGLETIVVSNALSCIQANAFYNANRLKAIVSGVVSAQPPTGSYNASAMFCYCRNLKYASIRYSNMARVYTSQFNSCNLLLNTPEMYGESNMIIDASAFYGLYSLTSIRVPGCFSIAGGAFAECQGMKVYDFSASTLIPTLSQDTAFRNIPPDCEIRVPASLVNDWKAATNWATYADNIVGV